MFFSVYLNSNTWIFIRYLFKAIDKALGVRIRNSSTRVFDIRHDFVIAASALFLSFSPSKQRIVVHDRYLLWERLDFRFFRRIPLSVHIVWLQFVSTHSTLLFISS